MEPAPRKGQVFFILWNVRNFKKEVKELLK